MKQKQKGKILVVFYVAGKRKLFFIYFEVFTWKKRLNFPDYTTDIIIYISTVTILSILNPKP